MRAVRIQLVYGLYTIGTVRTRSCTVRALAWKSLVDIAIGLWAEKPGSIPGSVRSFLQNIHSAYDPMSPVFFLSGNKVAGAWNWELQ